MCIYMYTVFLQITPLFPHCNQTIQAHSTSLCGLPSISSVFTLCCFRSFLFPTGSPCVWPVVLIEAFAGFLCVCNTISCWGVGGTWITSYTALEVSLLVLPLCSPAPIPLHSDLQGTALVFSLKGRQSLALG